GFGDRLGADDGVCARPIIDDDLLAQIFAHLLTDEPAKKIGGPAGREGNDERDLPRRIGLRGRDRNKKHEQSPPAAETPNVQFHVLDPSLIVLTHPSAASAGRATASEAPEQAPT